MGIKEDINALLETAEVAYKEAEIGVKIMESAGEVVVREKETLKELKRKIDAYKKALKTVEE
jgi:hypothetical protein